MLQRILILTGWAGGSGLIFVKDVSYGDLLPTLKIFVSLKIFAFWTFS